jgi:hypothetical protein
MTQSGRTTQMTDRINKKTLLTWAAIVPLAICLIYSIFYLVKGSILSRPLDDAVWAIAIFIIIAELGYNLELNMVKGYYRSYIGIGLLVTICALAIGVISTILGFIGFVALVPISILILFLCFVFSTEFFDVDRVPFILRVLSGALVVGLLVALAVFL